MTAALAAFSLQDKIEHYGAYAGIAAVFGLGVLSLLYFAQAREVKRLREWAGRAPERAAELEARVTADAQRRVTPAPPVAPRPTAPATPAAQQAGPPPTPGVAAPATAAAAAAGATAATVAKPGTAAPQNGTGSSAAVPAPGTEAKPGEDEKDGEAKDGQAKKPEEAGAEPAAGEPKPFGPQPKPAETGDQPPVPAATAAAAAGAAGAAGGAATSPSPAAGTTPSPAPVTTPSSAAPPPGRPAPLRAPMPSASLPPRTPAGARPRTDAGDGRSRGRLAAIVGAVVGVIAVPAVAGILIFGGGGDEPAPKPNTVAQPTTDTTANGSSTPSKVPAKLDRKAVPLAVLNGTTVTGLARGAADKLTAKGYNEPNVVTNDTTNQQRPATQVYYEAKARAAAFDVAKVLGVPTSQVKPMDANARALADRAQVAVFVGGDKAQ
jgi:LytR cell envelope-related transcriptional attenuator